jgi:hypothetical protein
MSEPIELNDAEHAAFRNALSTAAARRENYDATIKRVLEDINYVRTGDPAGTILRSSGGSGIAVRIGGVGEPDDWRVTWSDGRTEWRTSSVVADWTVLYRPEVTV